MSKLKEKALRSLDGVLRPLYLEVEAGVAEEIQVAIAEEILKHYINRDEAETKEFEVRNEAYEDGFKSANIVGKTIPISEATVRPTWEETSGYRGYIACSCGQILQTVGQTREHWQMGHFDRVKEETISIDEIKILIAREITIASSEGQPTSRLTSLYNKLPIDKSKEEEWVWCTECGKEKVYDGTICNSCKDWLVK